MFVYSFCEEQCSLLLVSTVHSPKFFGYSSKAVESDFCVFFTKLPHQNNYLATLVRLLMFSGHAYSGHKCSRFQIGNLCVYEALKLTGQAPQAWVVTHFI
jgi:hypothetical protein